MREQIKREMIDDLELRLRMGGEIRLQPAGRMIAIVSLSLLGVALAAIWIGFQASDSAEGTTRMWISMWLAALLMLLFWQFLRVMARRSAYWVDEHGWRNAYGATFAWDEIRRASVWTLKGNQRAALELDDGAYARVMTHHDRGVRALVSAQTALTGRKNRIDLPGRTAVPAPILAAWVNERIDRLGRRLDEKHRI